MTYEQLKYLKPSAYTRRCGVQHETFDHMVEVLRPALDRRGKRGGQCKLSVEDQLLLVLEYWRDYRTQFHIATSWRLSESAVCRMIQRVERLLMDSGKFRLPGKKQLYQNASNWNVLVIDVTESPIERPKKKQRAYYSGKKKQHTLKAQVVVNQTNGHIICTAFGKGRVHDFRAFQAASDTHVASSVMLVLTRAIRALPSCIRVVVLPPRSRAKQSLTSSSVNTIVC